MLEAAQSLMGAGGAPYRVQKTMGELARGHGSKAEL